MFETLILCCMIAMGIWAIGFLIYFFWFFRTKGYVRVAKKYHGEITPAELATLLLAPSSRPARTRNTLMRHSMRAVVAQLAKLLEELAPDKQEAVNSFLTAAGFDLSIVESQLASFGLEGDDAPRLRCAVLYPPHNRRDKWLEPGAVRLSINTPLVSSTPSPREGFDIDFTDWTFQGGDDHAYETARHGDRRRYACEAARP